MDIQKGNVVITGDAVYAGVDEHDAADIPNTMLIQFPSPEALRLALRAGEVEFTVFECPEETEGEDYVYV